MKISNIKVNNFRNLKHIDINLDQHAIIVGANGVGKSNLLFALRLILDSSLPDSRRYLDAEDFWDGLKKPFGGEEILVQMEFKEFEEDASLMAFLADAVVESTKGQQTARLSYLYRPRSKIEDKKAYSKEEYEFTVFQGTDSNRYIPRELRTWIQLFVLKALRDAERDFKTKYRSPLTPFFDRIYDSIDLTKLEEISKTIDKSSDEIAKLDEIDGLQKTISQRISKMIGVTHNLNPTFGVSSTESNQILNSIKLFLNDKKSHGFDKISLGYANIIYLLLHVLNIEVKQSKERLAACILGIEEPEAHLHPQIQRLIFKDIFETKNPTIVTTHSPNIVSVAPIKSIVILKNKGNYSTAKSLFDTELQIEELHDIQRYIDATRGEIYFAKGVIFVEGIAEKFLMSRIAELMSINLDQFGISVCVVNGTDFIPYLKLVSKKGLDIPYVIVTDGDKSKNEQNGYKRANAILKFLGEPNIDKLIRENKFDEAYTSLKDKNIFVGEETLEIDLINSDAGSELLDTFKQLNPTSQASTIERFQKITNKELVSGVELDWFIQKINQKGKGRFAQRLVSNINKISFPLYIKEALSKITELVKDESKD